MHELLGVKACQMHSSITKPPLTESCSTIFSMWSPPAAPLLPAQTSETLRADGDWLGSASEQSDVLLQSSRDTRARTSNSWSQLIGRWLLRPKNSVNAHTYTYIHVVPTLPPIRRCDIFRKCKWTVCGDIRAAGGGRPRSNTLKYVSSAPIHIECCGCCWLAGTAIAKFLEEDTAHNQTFREQTMPTWRFAHT